MNARLLALVLPLIGVGCVAESKRDVNPFQSRLLEISQSYESYPLVEAKSRWASDLCIPITNSFRRETRDLHFSNSGDSQTHGRKMYVLLAREVNPNGSYIEEGKPSPVGQVIVKEAWAPEEVTDDGKPLPSVARHGKTVIPYARREGKLYHAREKSALFIMFKMDATTPDTDEGWVYGTVTANGKTVMSAGRVESCMKCHEKAPHDRLFGLPANQ